jgi:hypothetical protein
MSEGISGTEVLRQARRYQDQIEQMALHLLEQGQLGQRAPRLFDAIGESLLLLTQIASCQWGCRRQDHTVENLVRRICNYAFAALRLSGLGFYDEALGLIRCLAELGNLLQLFALDPLKLEDWVKTPEPDRRKRFSPVNVRVSIESQNATPVTGKETYDRLCEIGIHATPSSIRLSHDLYGRTYVGGEFLVPGLLLVWSQLGRSLAPILTLAGQLVTAKEEQMKELEEARRALIDASGWLSVDNYEAFFNQFRADYFRETALEELSAMDPSQWQELVTRVVSELASRGRLTKSLEEMSPHEIEEIVYPAILEALVQKRDSESGSGEQGPSH